MSEFWLGFIVGVIAAYAFSALMALLIIRLFSAPEPEHERPVQSLNGYNNYRVRAKQ